jgi:D-glycero-alpha-D-manno-heptose 1-phosphate guanylyltransferase
MPEMPNALVLCGGAGLRLRSVTANFPKSMAGIGGRPFLELLLKQLRRNGFERVILAVGYQSDAIRQHFGNRAFGLDVAYSYETSPLGTGGAMRNAARLAGSESLLIMNGDSYTDANLRQFVADHEASEADVSVVVVSVDGRGDCGTVEVEPNGRIAVFAEKQNSGGGRYANAGIYMTSRHILCNIAEGQVSLEQDLFPQWLAEGRNIRAFVWPGTCVDIGTPERLESAQRLLENAEGAAQGQSQL